MRHLFIVNGVVKRLSINGPLQSEIASLAVIVNGINAPSRGYVIENNV